MRKLSKKWPISFTIIAFSMPVFYILFRYGKPEIFNGQVFAGRLVAAVFFSCENCKFSEIKNDSEELKCQLTGYTYEKTYSCRKSKPRE